MARKKALNKDIRVEIKKESWTLYFNFFDCCTRRIIFFRTSFNGK